jgi:hypothetical protein
MFGPFASRVVLISASVALAAASPALAGSVPLLPHQALYELSLKKVRSSASVESVKGRILYVFTGSLCEGYTTEFRQISHLDSGEGKSTYSDLHSVNWEEGRGKSFRFKIETRMNDTAASVVEGAAERRADKIVVKLKQPVSKTLTLDGSTLFPSQQVERILEAAKAGQTFLQLQVYDGSDTGEKVYSTMTVIGQPIPGDRVTATADPGVADDRLKTATRWPVTVSYFEPGAKPADGEQTPVYAMSFELYENGVSRELALDYNDFVIGGGMSRFDVKDAKPCK